MANSKRENEIRASMARALAREVGWSNLPSLARERGNHDVALALDALRNASSLTERQYARLVVGAVGTIDKAWWFNDGTEYTVYRYITERIAAAEREAAPDSAWTAFPNLYGGLVLAQAALRAAGLA